MRAAIAVFAMAALTGGGVAAQAFKPPPVSSPAIEHENAMNAAYMQAKGRGMAKRAERGSDTVTVARPDANGAVTINGRVRGDVIVLPSLVERAKPRELKP